MAQLNLYVPEAVAARLKAEADSAGISLSRYALSLLTEKQSEGWPEGYFEQVCGFLQDDFPEPEDALPEPIEPFEIR